MDWARENLFCLGARRRAGWRYSLGPIRYHAETNRPRAKGRDRLGCMTMGVVAEPNKATGRRQRLRLERGDSNKRHNSGPGARWGTENEQWSLWTSGAGRARMTVTQQLAEFWKQNTLQEPTVRKPIDPRQWIKLTEDGGLQFLGKAPATNAKLGTRRYGTDDGGENTHLWIIDEQGVPYIIEAEEGEPGGQLRKHTNLTGGTKAYLGGEMWFETQSLVYITGGSSRYPPRDNNQLEDAKRVFESFGYETISFGWDKRQNDPSRNWGNKK